MSQIIKYVTFPALEHASPDGLLAMGGELDKDTLVSAYAQGIFPWFNKDQPVLWWSPDPRLVLYPDEFKLSKSLRKRLRKPNYSVSINQHFEDVIHACATRGAASARAAQEQTWISLEMQQAYTELHRHNYAHSIEISADGKLIGGLYGIALGHVFFGESMFSRHTDASKIALFALCKWLQHKEFQLIDCQVASDHLFSLGAREISRNSFIESLANIPYTQTDTNFNQGFEQYWSENVINKL